MPEERGADDARSRVRAPIGTRDVLPPESDRWQALIATFAERASRFGFDLVVTPIFEHVEVFQRVGESTDVVRKEMYEFEDKGGRRLALRPEGTASVVRAFVQHRPPTPWKVWYLAPHFRYERPQKGRYRQHWQLGVEALGIDDPDIDVEVIALADAFYRALGLSRFGLLLNSMGDPASRSVYIDKLRDYLLGHGAALGDDFRERVEQNPLRVLDNKREDWQDVIEHAPQITEYLSDASCEHFEHVQAGLDQLGIEHELDPRLVRGFDYYTSTTFEFLPDLVEAAQTSIGGGGRYDQLAEQLGGPPTPGIGFGMGIERLLIACDAEGVFDEPQRRVDAFVVNGLGDAGELDIVSVVAALRANGLRVERAYGDRSVRAQWKAADRAHAAYGVMLGRAEAERDAVVLKDLQTGEQVEVPSDSLVAWLQARREDELDQ
jgi:histidyl-tRNA synthetase